MGNKSVDRDQMRTAANQIETKHQEIHALQKGLQDNMVSLQSRWIGRASTAFQAGYQQFDSEFEKVKQGLDTIHSQLQDTLREYTSREDENEGVGNQITGLLNG